MVKVVSFFDFRKSKIPYHELKLSAAFLDGGFNALPAAIANKNA